MPRARVEVEPNSTWYFERRNTVQRSRPSNITPTGQQSLLTQQRNSLTRFPPAPLLDTWYNAAGRYAEVRAPTQEWISNGSTVSPSGIYKKFFIYYIVDRPGRFTISFTARDRNFSWRLWRSHAWLPSDGAAELHWVSAGLLA